MKNFHDNQSSYVTAIIPNLDTIMVSYKGATDYKPSRMVLKSLRLKESVTISNSYEYNNMLAQALAYLSKKGFDVIGKTCNAIGDNDLIIVQAGDDHAFKSIK